MKYIRSRKAKFSFLSFLKIPEEKLVWINQVLFSNSKDLAGQRILFYTVILVLFLCLSWKLESLRNKSSSVGKPKHIALEQKSVDTMIPIGFRLIPIDIMNSESLDSILGQSGVVDLFTYQGTQVKKLFKVASRIKIIRAPNNPSVFAVLCKESESANVLRYEGPFIVGVSNPKTDGTEFVKSKGKSRIQYGDI